MNTDRKHGISARAKTLLGVMMATALAGCAGGVITSTVYTAAGATAAIAEAQQDDFQQELTEDYREYRKLFQASRCDPDQYQISPGILEYVRESPPTQDGFDKAQDILMRIYRDESQPRDIRAHALYTVALLEGEGEEADPEDARKYLRKVRAEFPGSHDCAVKVLLAEGQKI